MSRYLFQTHPLIAELRQFIELKLKDDFGHGVNHAVKVTIDSGALMFVEGLRLGYSERKIQRKILLTQCAGLLHDAKRKSNNHALHGAVYARQVLMAYPLLAHEIDEICCAIRNHEAFKNIIDTTTAEKLVISDCLYDADKFRWGPDNFTDTVWQMVSYYDPPLATFLTIYPKGLENIRKIKTSFRSKAGKKYGPQFIDLGLSVGEALFKIIQKNFNPGTY
jgi:hypothetical protein